MNAPTGPILFASIAHAGQISPLLAIAGELSRRRVPDLWFASSDDRRADVESASVQSPVRFVSFGGAESSSFLGEWNVPRLSTAKPLAEDTVLYAAATRGPMTTGGFIALMRWAFDTKRLTPEYRRMLAHLDRLRPRLMVIDLVTMGALDAAMTRRVPFILSAPCTPSALFVGRLPWDYPCPGSGLPRRMRLGQKLANLLFMLRTGAAQLTRSPFLTFTRQRKAMGMANPSASLSAYCDAAAAIFCYSIFGLEYPFPAPPHLHLLGAMVPSSPLGIGPRNEDELWRWLERHPSVIYVGLGTLVRLSRAQIATLLAAFGRLAPAHRVLWKLHDSQQALLPPRALLPPNVRIEHWVASQLDVLAHPHVRAFLTHGGGNGFHEGLYFGKPLLVMPFWLDCYDFAARAVDSGVGLALDRPPDFTADEIATKLLRLLTESTFCERARYWGDRLREAGGVGRAADLILEAASPWNERSAASR